jgi:hypothetical protein
MRHGAAGGLRRWSQLRTTLDGFRTRHRVPLALLVPVYGWYTEGLDTADLQEAKALLEELGG